MEDLALFSRWSYSALRILTFLALFSRYFQSIFIGENSQFDHVFFFALQVFFLVIVFGLFHGLIFFPALLGLIGPSAYALDSITVEEQDKEKSIRQTTKM